MFIHAVIGRHCGNLVKSAFVPRGFDVDIHADAWFNDYAIRANVRYKFDYDHKPLQEMPKVKKYQVNRKRMNEVRKVAKPFYEYIDTMDNLAPKQIETTINYWSNEYRNPAMLLQSLEDKEQWWSMFQLLEWQTQSSRYDYSASRMTYTRNVKAMKDKVDACLKEQSPQVLDEVF